MARAETFAVQVFGVFLRLLVTRLMLVQDDQRPCYGLVVLAQ
jgi:hypothetical protein